MSIHYPKHPWWSRAFRPVLATITLLLSLTLPTHAADRQWVIVEMGNPTADIVAADDAPMLVRVAADELQRYIVEMTKAQLEIRPPQHPDGFVDAALASIYLEVADTPDAASPGSYSVVTGTRNERDAIIITGSDPTGVLYGAYAFLEQFGVRFFHPEHEFVPKRMSLRTGPLNLTGTPVYAVRGFQQHTLHPIPWTTIFMDEPSAENLIRARHYIDWLVKNRQNYLYWWWVERARPPQLQEHVNAIVDYAHQRGVKVGLVVGMPFRNPQDSYDVMRCQACHKDRETWEACLQEGIDEIAALGIDSICVFFGDGEGSSFRQPEGCPPVDSGVDAVVDRIEVFQKYLDEKYPDIFLTLWIHPMQGTRGDDKCPNFFLLPQYAPRHTGAAIHTVKLYNLLDPAPSQYGTDFYHLRQFIKEQQGQRPQWYWPETAYACGFDIGVPMYWPAYLISRWTDAEYLAGKLEGHITFSSGLEWMYWFNDYATARYGYNPNLYGVPEVLDEYVSIYPEGVRETVRRVMWDLIWANDYYILKLGHDPDVKLMNLMTVANCNRTMDHLKHLTPAQLQQWTHNHLPPLRNFAEAYSKATDRLNAVAPEVAVEQLPWFAELRDSIEITGLRLRHHLLAFEGAVGMLQTPPEQRPRQLPNMEAIHAIRERAKRILERRKAAFRYPCPGYAGPYIGYMRPFYEWERIDQHLRQFIPLELEYDGVTEVVPAVPRRLDVYGAVGTARKAVVKLPSGYSVDRPLLLLGQLHDIDNPAEGRITINDHEFAVPQSGNAQLVTMQLPLPAGTLKPGANTILFTFMDDLAGSTKGYEVHNLAVAAPKAP